MPYTMEDHFIDIPPNPIDIPPNPCIFIVPAILRRHNPKSFTPTSFSFGPLYHSEERLKETEKIKQRYLANLLSRKPTSRTTQEEFKRSILELEGRARECYAFRTDHLDEDQFVDMLILDGCFIIELLRKNEIDAKINDKEDYDNNNYWWGRNNNNRNNRRNKFNDYTIDKDDPVFSVSWVLQVLYHDLILLENQIPWFVLECLFEMTSEKRPGTKSLTEVAMDFFAKIFSVKPLPPILADIKRCNHILDLIRNSLVFSSEIEQESMDDWQLIPTATNLKESGIKFERGKHRNLLDIRFSFRNGVLEIPSLLIQEITCDAFRNLISYEQCYISCEPKITSYAVLLSNLINTTKDIELLCKRGIFDNRLNLNDTLEFFKNLYTDTYVKEFYYAQIFEKVNEYRNRWWPRTRAAYVRMFWDPIGSLSLFAAAIALILTLLQTLFTILQYKESFNRPHQ